MEPLVEVQNDRDNGEVSMKSGLKIVVIGGGSSYTPELVRELILRSDRLSVERVTLVDISEGAERMRIVAEFAERLVRRAGISMTIDTTLDRRLAVKDADFICNQIRVGGLKARARDESIPLRHGAIGQETVGAGGFAKALRTVPVVLEIAQEIADGNPSAWLLNFVNPAGMVTQALTQQGIARTVGFCGQPTLMQRTLSEALKVDADRVFLDVVGLNHLSYVRRVFLEGRDVTDQALQSVTGKEWGKDLIQAVGLWPNPYLRYYWFRDDMLRHQKEDLEAGKGTRAIQVMALEAELFKKYQDPSQSEIPGELRKRGGNGYSEAAVSFIEAVSTDTPRRLVVNTRNGETLEDLPSGSVIEVSCTVDRSGARPIYCEPLPKSVRGLVQQVKAYEDLTIEAAISGRREVAYAALLNNPLIPSADIARKILDDILRENVADLPRFSQ